MQRRGGGRRHESAPPNGPRVTTAPAQHHDAKRTTAPDHESEEADQGSNGHVVDGQQRMRSTKQKPRPRRGRATTRRRPPPTTRPRRTDPGRLRKGRATRRPSGQSPPTTSQQSRPGGGNGHVAGGRAGNTPTPQPGCPARLPASGRLLGRLAIGSSFTARRPAFSSAFHHGSCRLAATRTTARRSCDTPFGVARRTAATLAVRARRSTGVGGGVFGPNFGCSGATWAPRSTVPGTPVGPAVMNSRMNSGLLYRCTSRGCGSTPRASSLAHLLPTSTHPTPPHATPHGTAPTPPPPSPR
ncbi:hypothetical protein ABIA38_008615 [Embleya sp. AB8]